MITADNLGYATNLAIESLEEIAASLASYMDSEDPTSFPIADARAKIGIISMQLSALSDDMDELYVDGLTYQKYLSMMRNFYPIAFQDTATKKAVHVPLKSKKKKGCK